MPLNLRLRPHDYLEISGFDEQGRPAVVCIQVVPDNRTHVRAAAVVPAGMARLRLRRGRGALPPADTSPPTLDSAAADDIIPF